VRTACLATDGTGTRTARRKSTGFKLRTSVVLSIICTGWWPGVLTTKKMAATAIALITGTPKSEVHKVNQRKLISVLEVKASVF